MPSRVVTVLLFVVALSGFAADMTVGCASQAYVYGIVQNKYSGNGDAGNTVLEIASTTYTVPAGFYETVRIGDLVRFDGKTWTIVKPAATTYDSPVPNSPAPGQVTPAPTPPAH